MIPWRLKDGTPQSSERREVTGLLWSHVPLSLSCTFPHSVATLLISSRSLLPSHSLFPCVLCLLCWRSSGFFFLETFSEDVRKKGKGWVCFSVGQHVYRSLLSGWHFPLSSIISLLYIPPFILCSRTGLSSSATCILWTILGKPTQLLIITTSWCLLCAFGVAGVKKKISFGVCCNDSSLSSASV